MALQSPPSWPTELAVLEPFLNTGLRHLESGDARPLLFAGPAGVGKSTCALALAARLKRPVLGFDVAVSGLRLGQREGLRELPLIPKSFPHAAQALDRAAPVVLIEQAERLPGGLVGALMTGLVSIATEKCPRALEHYFGIDSLPREVLFVFTTRSVPSPSLDSNFFVLSLSGYCSAEKEIVAALALASAARRLPAAIVRQFVRNYLPGPGVSELPALVAQTQALADEEFEPKHLAEVLGEPVASVLERYAAPGVGQTIAMAWTHEGGAHLVVEASFAQGEAVDLTVLGSVGEIMLGSARVALHVVHQLARDDERLGAAHHRPVLLNFPGSWVNKKDGQSAGLAIALALYGLATGRRMRRGLAVTGELTLGGLVLPVMGCMTKLLATEREGMTHAIFPEGNRSAFRAAPTALRNAVALVFVASFREAIDAALLPAGA